MPPADETDRPAPARPDGPYWEDPVYRHVSRRHRAAAAEGDAPQADRLAALMQQLVDGSVPDEVYERLAAEVRSERRRRKQRKRRQRPAAHASPPEPAPAVNVADLKKRIYNPNVSRENVIKALEALPPGKRKATIAGLPPGLRRKLGAYLKGTGP